MKLKRYLDTKGIKIKHFAMILEVDPSHLSRWITGKVMPRVETIKKIEQLTEGNVTVIDWYDDN